MWLPASIDLPTTHHVTRTHAWHSNDSRMKNSQVSHFAEGVIPFDDHAVVFHMRCYCAYTTHASSQHTSMH